MPREVYIDPGIIKDTADICKSLHLDKKILIVTGSHTYDIGAVPVIESLEKSRKALESEKQEADERTRQAEKMRLEAEAKKAKVEQERQKAFV